MTNLVYDQRRGFLVVSDVSSKAEFTKTVSTIIDIVADVLQVNVVSVACHAFWLKLVQVASGIMSDMRGYYDEKLSRAMSKFLRCKVEVGVPITCENWGE